MTLVRASFLAACLASSVLSGCNSADKPKPAAEVPLSVEDSVEVDVTAKVKAIDQATRQVTLQDEQGHEISFVVDPAVSRLNEVKPGDRVNTRYRAHLLAELRPPTAEETAHPIAAADVAGRTPQGDEPGAAGAQAVRVVTTVAAVDVPNMLVTLRGPMGDLAVVKGRKPENVRKLKVGDTIVITYSETMAISLEKAAAK
jgi:hypothetical protein